MPVLVGSLGRIATGALTDRFGGRLMFTAVTLISIGPVLLVALAGSIGSYTFLLIVRLLAGHCRNHLRDRHPVRQRAGTRPRDAASPPDCSAPGWVAPRCRPSSPHGSSAGSATSPRT